MSEALELVYYVLQKLLNFLFEAEFFEGVSIGMFLVGAFVFSVLIRFVLAIPNVRVGGRPSAKEEKD